MAVRRSGATSRTPILPPALPPKSAVEEAVSRSITADLRAAADALRARNLSNAVLLAQQAACGHGPLIEHFAELGRRYGDLLEPSRASRTTLRVVEGGAA